MMKQIFFCIMMTTLLFSAQLRCASHDLSSLSSASSTEFSSKEKASYYSIKLAAAETHKDGCEDHTGSHSECNEGCASHHSIESSNEYVAIMFCGPESVSSSFLFSYSSLDPDVIVRPPITA